MSDPAEDVPGDRPVRRGDGDFELGALGLGVPGAAGVGAVVELADQLDRAFEGMKAAIAVIADVHHVSTDRTVAVKDVEFPGGEIGIRRPIVRHLAPLHVLVRSTDRGDITRRYATKPAESSLLSDRCRIMDWATGGFRQSPTVTYRLLPSEKTPHRTNTIRSWSGVNLRGWRCCEGSPGTGSVGDGRSPR